MKVSILFSAPGYLDHERMGTDVYHAAAGNIPARVAISAALVRTCRDRDQHQVALDEILAADVLNRDYGHDLVELLAHLFQDGVVAAHHEGDTRKVGVFGFTHGQAVDVEAARSHHPRDLGKYAGRVLYKGGQDVPHAAFPQESREGIVVDLTETRQYSFNRAGAKCGRQPISTSATPMTEPRLDKMAQLLVRYSCGVQPGNVVALVAPPLAEPLLLAVYREVLLAGGRPVVHMEPEANAELLLKHGNADQLGQPNPFEAWLVENCDVSIYLLAPMNTRALTQIDSTRQSLLERGRRRIMDTFLRRAAQGELRWSVAQMPCLAAAQEAGRALSGNTKTSFTALHYSTSPIQSEPGALSERQQRLIEFLQGVSELRFLTPDGTDLKVHVAARTWMNSDGRENLPDGEVFTGPHEAATEGAVHFNCPALHKGREISDIRLGFRNGRVVEASAARGEDYLLGLLDLDAGSRVLGEVALRMQSTRSAGPPRVIHCLTKKIGGTIPCGVGGLVSGHRRPQCLIAALRIWSVTCAQGGVIEADGMVISRNGKSVDAAWPQPT